MFNVLTQRMTWKPIKCGYFWKKVYLRSSNNGHKIRENVYFKPDLQLTLIGTKPKSRSKHHIVRQPKNVKRGSQSRLVIQTNVLSLIFL